jgi:hypothetical protein
MRKWHYYVTFSHADESEAGFGAAEIMLLSPITTMAHVEHAREFIAGGFYRRLPTIVVLGWQLLRIEEED